jgi:hypothetical protein
MAAKQVVKADQIKGMYGVSLEDDIKIIVDKAMNYDKPVQTRNDLPMTDNQVGDVRLVMSEGKFYQWNGTDWEPTKDIHIESRQLEFTITQDGQSIIPIDIEVGVVNGIASMDTIQLLVNGIIQKKNTDYTADIQDNKVVITWISPDFMLETTDSVQVVYDILLHE